MGTGKQRERQPNHSAFYSLGGGDISKFTKKKIQAIEDWMNNYPRKILYFEIAEERFIQEMAA